MPKRNPDRSIVTIAFRVAPEFHDKLLAEAGKDGNTVAAFCRSAVAEKLRRLERETVFGPGASL